MQSTLARIVLSAAVVLLPSALAAEPLKVVHAPAKDEAPVRVEAAMFDMDVDLSEAGALNELLLQSGVDAGSAASAASLAEGQVADHEPCRAKIGLARNTDTGAISLQRLVLSTAATQTVIEQRSGKLEVVSTAARKLRTV
jgi:hypothetical protein